MSLFSLVLHPDPRCRERFARLLVALGSKVVALAAPEPSPSASPDLAVVGGPDAEAWIRSLRARRGGDATYVLLADATEDLPDGERLLASGVDDFAPLDAAEENLSRRLGLALRRAAERARTAHDTTRRVRAERALERLLEGMTHALTTVLVDTRSFDALERVLRDVADLAEVDDVYVAEHHPRGDDGLDVAVIHRFSARAPANAVERASGRAPEPRRAATPYERALERGELVALRACDVVGDARARLDAMGAKSWLMLPVFLDGRCWGQISLFDREERTWEAELTATLSAIAASIGALLAHGEALLEFHDAHERFAEQVARLHALYSAISNPTLTLSAQLERVLATGCGLVDAEVAIVTRVRPDDDGSCAVEIAWPDTAWDGPGARVPFVREAWEASVRDGLPRAMTPDVDAAAPDDAAAGTSIGAAVWVRGEPYGALEFQGASPRPEGFRATDLDVVRLIARWVGLLLERMQDDDQRRQLESRFREAQKLESLGLLAGGIAHDFNNLLMVILGNASLAVRELPRTSSARDAVEQVAMAAKRSAELTRQMLAFAGREPRRDAVVLLASVVQESIQQLATTIPEPVDVWCELDDVPAMYADGAQIRSVVTNLVMNAVEAIGARRGHVVVRTGIELAGPDGLRGTVGSEDLGPGRYAYVEVEDDGCGIGPGTLARIFDPFFSTKLTGRGLGLATALGIVRSHRGAIRVTSEPGRGSTFRALLPLDASDEPAAYVEPQGDVVQRVLGRVLVADDDDAVRRTIAAILVRNGLDVIHASSGAEALALVSARGADIDLVLLDVMMPGMDGPTALRALRALRPRLPVVLMSGHTEALTSHLGGEPVEFLQKPISASELLARIAPALRPG